VRLAKFREAEALALEQQPLIPLYTYTRTQLVKPYVRGIWGNHQDRHPWKYIWIDEAAPAAPAADPPPPAPGEAAS
jgi:oligopeptide transport system substrate-binding protein